MKKLILYLIPFFMFILSSCDSSVGEVVEPENSVLTLDTRSVSPVLANNTRMFMFDGDSRNNASNQFFKEIIGINRNDDKLTARVEAGLWNLRLVSCENSPFTGLISPQRGIDPKDIPMWRNIPVAGELKDMPQICTALINGINILPDTDQNASAKFLRHVGMVRVVLKDGVGFSTGGGHTVYLKNVPTTLSWGGSLYPGRDNPEHSEDVRITKELTFSDASGGHQKSNEVEFIVPTHLSADDTDITTHKLVLGVKFKSVGGSPFEREVTINEVPRDNKILQVNILAKGGVEVQTEIADWNLESSTSNPELYEMIAGGYNAATQEWTFTMKMNQERNWWVKLEGTYPKYFDFVDSSTTSGQAGTTTIRVRRSNLHPGGSQSSKLTLYISGYSNAAQSWDIAD